MARVSQEDILLAIGGLDYAIDEYWQAEDEVYHEEAPSLERVRDFLYAELRKRSRAKTYRKAKKMIEARTK